MAKFHAVGDFLDYTPVAAVAAGQPVKVGTFVGIADNPIPANTKGALRVTGIYRFPAALLASVTIGTEMDIDMVAAGYPAVANGSGDTAIKIFAAVDAAPLGGGGVQDLPCYLNRFGG